MRKIVSLSLILVFSLLLSAGVVVAEEGGHWGYEGEYGPEHWGSLSHDYAICSAGREQSPIDVPSGAPVHSADIVFNYQPTALNIVNNGHSVKVDYGAGGSMTVEGKTYKLLQFHFHSLSEHTFHGGYYDMEMHLVHQSADGEYAVIGIMLERGTENAAYTSVWNHMPAAASESETISGVTVNAADLLPQAQTYYRYNGSFTTPPCTEDVKWFVMNTPVELSDAQVDAFRQIYTGNYRPVLPFYDRSFNPPAATTASPALLPETGGVVFPTGGVLAGFGVIVTAAGLYLRRRKIYSLPG